MALNDFSPTSSSDSEVSEMDDYDLKVEGSPNLSAMASDEDGMQEAYADDPLADEEWLELYERKRKEEEALEKEICPEMQEVAKMAILAKYCHLIGLLTK